MSILKNVTHYMLIGITALSLAACNDGKAERAGEKIDEAVQDAGNAVEDACEEVKEKANAEDTDC
ncbi:hypothetical protein [Neptunomonas marina]|uniref:YtxH domain-containing protein n=1 Tax=Neptunomonas marina TaxID=1815562 RepID=A0A437Q633_9GAMM|nr:hypothetical protein [Neptunomonas marina]RVU29952.1 hypothetical protein EOE65_12860 [Neptunomonas marina]